MDKERKILQALADRTHGQYDHERMMRYSTFIANFHDDSENQKGISNIISIMEIMLDVLKISHGIENSVAYCRLTNLAQYARELGFNNPERVKGTDTTPDIGSTVYVNKHGSIYDGTITAKDGGTYYGKTRIGRLAFAFTDEDINRCVWLTEKEAERAVKVE